MPTANQTGAPAGRSPNHLIATVALALTIIASLALAPTAAAQAAPGRLLVGVVASRTGSAAAPGAAQWLLATQWAAQQRAAGGIFGVEIELELLDDGSSPETARRLARQLVDQGALAIVCCTTPVASQAVAAVAEEAGVTLLAPTDIEAASASPYWAFSLAPDETDAIAAIVADAYRENKPSLALMALTGPLGDGAAADLAALLAVVGKSVSHETRYRPGVTELRPEALLTASTQPGGVVVWGLDDDLLVAYDALRRRGYEGTVYGRSSLLQPGSASLPWVRLLETRFAVAPAVVPQRSAADQANPYDPQATVAGSGGACAAAGAVDARRLAEVAGGSANAVATAPFLAALDLVRAGLEQLIALQIPSNDPPVLRQALRDAFVGRPERCTGAGLVDLRDGHVNAVEPRGLAIAVVTRTGLQALP